MVVAVLTDLLAGEGVGARANSVVRQCLGEFGRGRALKLGCHLGPAAT